MGIFSRKVEAQQAPQIMSENWGGLISAVIPRINRKEAMSVPSVARARNLICGTIGSIPLEYYKKSTGEEIGAPRWVEQPSRTQPRFVTITFTVESLLLYGVSYWEVTEVYAEDGRPASFEWVANSRVTFDTDMFGTKITQYYVDGAPRPMSGNGSLVTFQGFDEGILDRGARTIQAAIDVERAAAVNSANPQPSGYIKNTGAELPPAERQGLMASWKQARQSNSTAYLSATLDYNPVSFTPKDMMYNEAIQNLSTQIARLCNLPAYLLSADQNTSMTYSNIQDERKQFLTLSLQPYISAIEERLSLDDISTSGHMVKFDIDKNFLRTDPLVELQVIEKLLQLELVTPEQAMAMTDLTPNGKEGM